MRTMLVTLIACAAVVMWTSAGLADEQGANKSVGKISGVVMKDGKPVANARVGVMAARVNGNKAKSGGNGGNDVKRSNDDASAPSTQPSDSGKGQRKRELLNKTTTDADGKFSIDGLAPGEYVVVAGVKGEGRGRERISVAANQDTNVQITLQATNGGGDGAGGDKPKDKDAKPRKKFQKLGL